ncbi:MAG: sulfatase family protein, partial [Solirubrobacteraceae bacterium]
MTTRSCCRLLALALVALVAGCGGSARPHVAVTPTPIPLVPPHSFPPSPGTGGPNIVFVLTDDLSSDLLRFMPHVRALEREGTSFSRYVVSDSLCCPSRTSIFTGRLPHDTGVFTNVPPDGGFRAFMRNGNVRRTFARTLRARGYRTALMGKYLNGYHASRGGIPLGWTDWSGSANGYAGYDYTLDQNGTPAYYGHRPTDYITDVLAYQARSFVDQAAHKDRPFMLELATFAPHRPAVPAFRDRALFAGLRAPRGPAFNRPNRHPPLWLAGRTARRAGVLASIDRRYRRRAQSVVAVDEMVGSLRRSLQATGEAADTYFVFSSDNGYHMGEHRLLPGKLTAFDSDVRVPLIVTGPGVPGSRRVGALPQDTHTTPTSAALTRARPGPRA